MKSLRNLINILYSGYCFFLFFISMLFLLLILALVYFTPDRVRAMVIYRTNRVLSWLWFKLCGFSLSVEGWDKVDPDKTYVFVGNHSNQLDINVLGYFLQHYYKSLVKKEVANILFFGMLMKVNGIMVDRENAASRMRSSQMMVDKLRNGVSLMIFPEGSRNTDLSRPMGNFFPGAFKTAAMAAVPIVPFVILDHRYLQPVGTLRLYPGTIRVKVLDAIETAGLSAAEINELQPRIYKLMEDTILREDVNFGGAKA